MRLCQACCRLSTVLCIEQAVRTGLGLGAQINLHSVFERKNYFYPDLPQGYQISQYLHPIVGEGVLTWKCRTGSVRSVLNGYIWSKMLENPFTTRIPNAPLLI